MLEIQKVLMLILTVEKPSGPEDIHEYGNTAAVWLKLTTYL